MKKTIIISIVFIFLGIITGKTIYYIKNNINKNIYNEQVYYFIQEGVYANKEIMEENTKKLCLSRYYQKHKKCQKNRKNI